MVKKNEVAFLKTTGEAVFVLDIIEGEAEVRRPVFAQSGNTHVIDTFYTVELESEEEQKAKFDREREGILKKYGPKASDLPPVTNSGVGIN